MVVGVVVAILFAAILVRSAHKEITGGGLNNCRELPE